MVSGNRRWLIELVREMGYVTPAPGEQLTSSSGMHRHGGRPT
jgi:hypothetical protein